MSLPSFVSFNIEQKYLRPVRDGICVKYINDEEGAASPLTRFAVERADNNNVHLRHCYTNVYLARGDGTMSSFISAILMEPVTDNSSKYCTLFKVEINDQKKVSLVHIQSGLRVGLDTTQGNNLDALKLEDGTGSWATLETQYFDLESLVMLPKRVVFKGDNGLYLTLQGKILRFISHDAAEPKAQFEVVVTKIGHTAIKSIDNGSFWYVTKGNESYDKGWIMVDLNDYDGVYIAWFTIFNGPNNTIAIRGAERELATLFGQRQDANGLTDGLMLTANSLMPRTLLQVQEPVVKRTVWVDFRLDNSRIYNAKPLVAATATVKNESTYEHQTQLDVSYTKISTSTWNNTFHTMAGVTTTFVTKVPFIFEGRIETRLELEYQHEWGGSVSKEETVSNTQIVNLPPLSIATATVMATEGKCNIPFSYRQVDQLLNGEKVETVLYDGVYDNVSNYSFYTIIQITSIDDSQETKKKGETNKSAIPLSRKRGRLG